MQIGGVIIQIHIGLRNWRGRRRVIDSIQIRILIDVSTNINLRERGIDGDRKIESSWNRLFDNGSSLIIDAEFHVHFHRFSVDCV